MPKRQKSPEKVTQAKRKRLAELPNPTRTSQEGPGMLTRLKRKVLDEGEGPSNPAKKLRRLGLVQANEELASSSVDTSKGRHTDVPLVFPTPAQSCHQKEKVCTRNGKRKAAGDGKVSPRKKRKSLDQEETRSSPDRSAAQQRRKYIRRKYNEYFSCIKSVSVCSGDFEAKYVQQQQQLGAGGCGSVFAGYRKVDHCPVSMFRCSQLSEPMAAAAVSSSKLCAEMLTTALLVSFRLLSNTFHRIKSSAK